jgi:hypothetical protein
LGNALENPKAYYRAWTGTTSEIGEEMTSNPIVKKFTFTGSTGISKVKFGSRPFRLRKTPRPPGIFLAAMVMSVCERLRLQRSEREFITH